MSDNKNKWAKVTRQSRQIGGVYSDASEAVKDPRTLRRASEMVCWITGKENGGRGLSLRWLEKHTPRGFGFWQHIAKRHRCVVLRRGDFAELTRVYKILQEHVDMDSCLLDLVLNCQAATAEAIRAQNALVDFVRNRLGSAGQQ